MGGEPTFKVSVRAAQCHLSFECAKEKGEVTEGDDYARYPPHEADGEAVATGFCVLDREARCRSNSGRTFG